MASDLRKYIGTRLYSRRFGRRLVFLKHLCFPSGSSENRENSFCRELRLEGKTVYDIGANIGLFTLLFSRLVGKNGRVYSFEPNSDVFNELVSNVKIARIKNTHCLRIGLGETCRAMLLYVPENNTGHGSANKSVAREISGSHQYKTYDIDVCPLDEFLEKYDLDMPDLVKIDVEGMEIMVLKGMPQLLTNHCPDLLVEVHEIDRENRAKNAGEIIAYLEKYKYEMIHVENKGRLLGTEDAEAVVEGHIYATKQSR